MSVHAGPVSAFRRLLSADEAALVLVHGWRVPRLTRVLRAVTHLGDGKSWTLLALAFLAAGGPSAGFGLRVGLAAGLAALAAQVFKRSLRRPRPSHGIAGFQCLDENPDAFSFPSGHTASAVAVALALAGQGAALGPCSLALAALIGFSRVYLGAHYPLDVAAGVVIGIAGGVGARLLLP